MISIETIQLGKRMMRVYESYCAPVLKKYGIAQNVFNVVMFLANNPGCNTARDICELRGMKSGIVCVVVEKLRESGMLVQQCDLHDRRRQRLILTPAASALVQDGRAAQQRFAAAIDAGLSPEDTRALRTAFSRLTDTVAKLEREL